MTAQTTIKLAHSPDPDDAFMWWPLFSLEGRSPRIETGRFTFEPVQLDIEVLNQRAMKGEYEITAISCAQYPRVRGQYAITACGSSMGDAYGPKLVTGRTDMDLPALKQQRLTIAVPGEHTSAFGALSLMLGKDEFTYEVVPFDRIIDVVAAGEVDAGVVIHEGQLTFGNSGLRLLLDLGEWWSARTGYPLPLGINVIRRDLEDAFGDGALAEITSLLQQSLEYALSHREESIAYAMNYARGMETDLADEFVQMYVNKWTLDFGDRGREAVALFLNALHQAEIAPPAGEIDFVNPATVS